jgi:hypothetical protein
MALSLISDPLPHGARRVLLCAKHSGRAKYPRCGLCRRSCTDQVQGSTFLNTRTTRKMYLLLGDTYPYGVHIVIISYKTTITSKDKASYTLLLQTIVVIQAQLEPQFQCSLFVHLTFSTPPHLGKEYRQFVICSCQMPLPFFRLCRLHSSNNQTYSRRMIEDMISTAISGKIAQAGSIGPREAMGTSAE